jgi:site-specific DNA-methyltransferase (adenine-specific)
MTQTWELINQHPLTELSTLADESKKTVVVSTLFDPADKRFLVAPQNYALTTNSVSLLSECVRVLEFGGLLFVYGLPHQLAFWGQHLSNLQDNQTQMIFKYWITLNIDDALRGETLKPTSQGLLMFLKSKSDKQSPTKFHLNISTARTPHAYCSACGLNVKDWGGKKHLMNPHGTALSDVWRDLPKIRIRNNVVPNFVLDRILALTREDNSSYLHVVQDEIGIHADPVQTPVSEITSNWPSDEWEDLTAVEWNKVYQGECISFLEKVSALHSEGIFDLVFADPPYNLGKNYDKYKDALAEQHYIDWCNKWLEAMVRTLKPGGSLFVLNLPKWAIHHAAYLNRRLDFRHWITWDALSDPRGKIMPAHYALLYYTKPGGQLTFNYAVTDDAESSGKVGSPDSPRYCLRASCVKRRKRLNDDEKVELSDVWFDIHRIKHKRDRDAHPCQLPEKLMERVILMSTDRAELVFDPFSGAGTTALAAAKLGRNFVVTEIDPNYVRITEEKLKALEWNANLFGIPTIPRYVAKKAKSPASKKEIEIYLQGLARQLGREPSEQDIETDNADILRKIDLIYPNRLAAIKRCRVALRTLPLNT